MDGWKAVSVSGVLALIVTASSPWTVATSRAQSSAVVPDVTAPTVSMAGPADGALVSGLIGVSAAASDNVGVTSVQFTVDGINLGVPDTVAPYSINWNTTAIVNGLHALRAIARDAAGNSTTSAPVTITVINGAPDTTAPVVALTTPAAGGTVSGLVAVSATASDNIGVVGVQFTLDDVPLGAEDLTSPYAISWTSNAVTNGPHLLKAIARDGSGNTGISSRAVTVSNVLPDTTPPSVGITAPSPGATVRGTIMLAASASDNVAVVGVQFKVDGVAIGSEDTTAPYQLAWNSRTIANGPHVLTATARDATGNVGTAAAVDVTILNGVVANKPGDLNGDGWVDLLFQHANGQIYAWFMGAATMTGSGAPSPSIIDASWGIVAIDDFDLDGQNDFVWQHSSTGQVTVWLMNGLNKIGELTPLATPTPWRVSASGDINGDGQPDLIWQHPTTGQLYVWIMDTAGVRLSEGYLTPSQVNLAWRIAATADINMDGKIDLIWQNSTDGSLAIWYMNGLSATTFVTASPSSVAPVWSLRAVFDMDLDGKPDFVFQNTSTGQMYVWYMDGPALRNGSFLTPQQVALVWQIVGGR